MAVRVQDILEQTFVPLLNSLDAILAKAELFAEERQVDLVNARLTPDMFTLAQQVQIATYFARETPRRLQGHAAAPDIGEPATTLDGMRRQVSDALEALSALSPADFDGAEAQQCTIEPTGLDLYFDMTGEPFLLRWSLPNFHFHVTVAYAILRKEGLDIGKRDYLGSFDAFRRMKS